MKDNPDTPEVPDELNKIVDNVLAIAPSLKARVLRNERARKKRSRSKQNPPDNGGFLIGEVGSWRQQSVWS
ncbi:hypothetical protein HDF14_002152 [Edaphobacter lichenicola]|jgi:hypothetical protein|uniref:Uncharacterized protein n=1 Tax=Tunturiibacter gelidiferens TaxID=3069689 RepID=A0A9X0QDU6_9BACT|nr:hypothetical protein [Edaphobacter lichenicola]